MRSISIELSFEIDEDWTTRGEFLIGDGLLKLCVAFVHFRGERSSVEFSTRHSKLVDKGKFKIAQAFDRGIASGFRERRGAATRNEDCGGTEENISRHKRRIHMAGLLVADLAPIRSHVSRLEDRGFIGPNPVALV